MAPSSHSQTARDSGRKIRSCGGHLEMKPHEGDDLFDDFARRLTVVVQVECVRASRVVYERHGEIAREGLGEKQVERVVQARELLSASPDDEQRHVAWKIGD